MYAVTAEATAMDKCMQNDKCGANIHRENVTLGERRRKKSNKWALRGKHEESNKLAKENRQILIFINPKERITCLLCARRVNM